MSAWVKRLLAFSVVVTFSGFVQSAEYFVDCNRPDDAGDGLTEATAKRTIQAAVTLAEKGDAPRIVTVLPGTYDEGGLVMPYECDQPAYVGTTLSLTNRVHIKKGLTLRAKDPTRLTEIVGAWDTSDNAANAAIGIGPAAVRCVLVETSDRVVIQGFTLRDGAAQDDNTRTTRGYWPTLAGGVAYRLNFYNNFILADCTVRRCSGRRGAALAGGKLIRCRVVESYGSSVMNVVALHTVISDQRNSPWSQYLFDDGQVLCNCTVFKNAGSSSSYFSNGSTIKNTLVLGCETFTGSSGVVNASNSVVACAWVGAGKKDAASVFGDSEAYYLFKSPLDEDWRLRSDSAYLTLGDAAHIAGFDWAADFEPYKDMDGNTLPTSGAIAPGCTQSTFTPVCGAIYLNDSRIVVDGTRKAFVGAYFYPEDRFAQHRLTVTLEAGTYLHSWNALYDSWLRFPATDDSLMVMPPFDFDTRCSNTPKTTTQTFWVDPENGDDTDNDGSQEFPFKTLLKAGQAARDLAATSGDNYFVVFAAAGTYDKESVTVNAGLTRVYDYGKSIRFLGAGAYGEGRSVIAGALDPDVSADVSPYGRGPKAVRCARLEQFTSCLQNFEVRDGRCPLSDGGTTDGNRGGGIMYGAMVDCHVVNCGAGRGQAAYYGRLERCRLTKPDPIPGARIVEDAGYLVSCILEQQVGRSLNNALTDARPMVQCTFSPYSGCRLVGSGAKIFNCLSSAASSPTDGWNYSIYGLVGPYGIPLPKDKTPVPDNLNADPQFANAAQGDFRLMSTSPAIGYGSLRSLSSTSDDSGYWRTYSPDIDGRKILFYGGKPLPGAVQAIVQKVTVATSNYGTTQPSGTTFIEPNGTLTVSFVSAVRPPRGFSVDGVETNALSVALTAPATPSGDVSVVPLFGTNWYANASAPNENGDGFTPETAKRTLISLCTNKYVLAGDVIHAAAGDYNEGASGSSPRNRVVVKSGVTVVADEGQAVTFITGAPAEGCTPGGTGGCGETAVRCAFGYGGSILKGFTLRDGYAHSSDGAVTSTYAGGYLGESATARIQDCTITNCFGKRSALAHGGRYEGCSLMGNNKAVNTGFDGNNLGMFGGFYSCRILTSHNWSLMAPVVNCILCNKSTYSTSGQYQIYVSASALKYMTNCIVVGSIRNTSGSADNYYPAVSNNIVCTGFAGTTPSAECLAWFKVLTSAQIATAYDTATLAFKGAKDANFCDAGVNVTGQENDTDVNGGPRIYNRTVDIGPAEYDWRGDFAAGLGYPGLEIAAMSANVTTNALGKLRLTDGCTASLRMTSPDARQVAFSVADGVLTAKGGRKEKTFDADGTYAFRPPAILAFGFLGEGYADLERILDKQGFLFTIR